jgi:hypothetical protein
MKNQKSPPKADPPLAEKINPSTLLRVDGEQSRTIKYKKFGIIFLLSVLVLPQASLFAQEFNPNLLISDERFVDTATLGGVEGIQKFLETRGSALANTSPDFLVKLREPGDTGLKSRLPDPRPSLGRLRTAAELIYDASTSAGLNPQVVLVTLQKEQSLIDGIFTSDRDLQRALDRAVGFGCPDEGGCNELFLGFYYQLFGNFDAAGERYIGMPMSLIKSFNYEVSGVRVGRGPMVDANNNAFGNGNRVRTARRGDAITLENAQGSPFTNLATQTVTLSNFATAALYRYTPHVYNGNYNYWRFFIGWFKYPNGTLVQTAGDSKTYVLDNGLRRVISAFVITERKLDPAKLVMLSLGEMTEYPLGDVMPPIEGTVLKNAVGQYYLIEDGKRELLSSFVAAQRKINLANAVLLPDEELSSYADGGRALPEEGTLVKSKDSPAVYVITNQEKRLLSAFVFKQRGYKFSQVLAAEPGELDSYPTGKLMPPLDGTLIKAKESPAVYYVGNGLLEPISYFVFTQKKFKFKDVVAVAFSELAGWEVGKPLPPPTGLLVKSKGSPGVYYLESGVKRGVSYGVFLARRFSFKDVIVAEDTDLAALETGDDLPLPDRALVKTKDNAAVYYLVEGVLRPLTLKAFQNRRLLFKDVVTITPEELAKYPIGAVVEN